MRLTAVKAILFCLYASLGLCSTKQAINLTKNVSVPAVFMFGDSFLDQGNNDYLTALAKANFAPYGEDFVGGEPTGRFSNGKTLADFFAEALGVKEYLPAYSDPSIQDKDLHTGVSFASGGSGFDPLTNTITSAISLSDQLDMFKQYIGKLKRNIGEEATKNIITNSVVFLSESSNDLANYFLIPIRSLQYDVPAYDNMLVKLAMDFVQEIHKLGARRIAVLAAPPLGCLPASRTLGGGPLRMCQDKQNEAAQLYNRMLKEQLQFLASSLPQSRVAFVEFYNSLISIIQNPLQYGLEVIDKGCCGTGDLELSFLCNKLSPTCDNRSKFLFWDSAHLSEKGCNIVVDHLLPDLLNNLFFK